ncbi:hypothetical protein niasHT_020346 [Heterodera trifolii]|uniref:Uncharacterized protein n=1 Tax=Heterodera trifolii TaxID=157864 RepID=A0ABD2JX25_9BILA
MSNITKPFLLLILLVAVSFHLSTSTDGKLKENANDGSGSNASVGIGTKIKRIVTAGLLFTSLAAGGAGARFGETTFREEMSWDRCTKWYKELSHPPPPPELTPLEKAEAIIEEHAKKHTYNAWFNASERESPGGPDPHHHDP